MRTILFALTQVIGIEPSDHDFDSLIAGVSFTHKGAQPREFSPDFGDDIGGLLLVWEVTYEVGTAVVGRFCVHQVAREHSIKHIPHHDPNGEKIYPDHDNLSISLLRGIFLKILPLFFRNFLKINNYTKKILGSVSKVFAMPKIPFLLNCMFPVFAKTVLKSFVDKAFPISKTGRPRSATTEELIDHIFILLKTGTQWRLLPTGDKVSWQTVHRHFQKWSKEGIFQRTYDHLLKLYCTKFSKTRQFIITDCSFVKNIFGIDCLGPSPVDRGRKASKLSIIVDEQGIVWSATFHPGNKSDPKAFLHTLSQAS